MSIEFVGFLIMEGLDGIGPDEKPQGHIFSDCFLSDWNCYDVSQMHKAAGAYLINFLIQDALKGVPSFYKLQETSFTGIFAKSTSLDFICLHT